MSAFINRIGKKYGKLTVIRRVPNRRINEATWMCRCDCGAELKVTSNNLGRSSKSCGCSRRKRPFEWMYNKLKKRAKLRKIYCGFTYAEFLHFTSVTTCSYCGEKIVWEPFPVRKQRYSQAYNIDRIDNSKGYSLNNCVVCCWKCNKLKGSFLPNDFLSQCQKIAAFKWDKV